MGGLDTPARAGVGVWQGFLPAPGTACDPLDEYAPADRARSRGSIVLAPSALAPQVTIRPQDRDLHPWMPAPRLRTLEI